jgi:tetratricopeptide (TPR) repeat protein
MHCLICYADSIGGLAICDVCGKPLPTDADQYFKAGMEAMACGDVARCIDLLEDCLGLKPDHTSGRYNIALALSLSDKCDDALEYYSTIADENPNYPSIYTVMGQAVFGSYLSHIRKAETQRKTMIQLFMQAIERDPEDVDAYFSLGNAYIALGNADKALPWLKTALRLHPDSSAIYFTMGRAFKMLNKHHEATVMAAKAAQLSGPDDPFWDEIQSLCTELEQSVLPL